MAAEQTTLPMSFSALLGTPVADAEGRVLGRIAELSNCVEQDGTSIEMLLLRGKGKTEWLAVPVSSLEFPDVAAPALRSVGVQPLTEHDETALLLDRDLLDQQIIDVDGRKVVRVNDVNLVWAGGQNGGPVSLHISNVEVGLRGAVRRLLKGLPAGLVEGVAQGFKAHVIPWECVDLIERDPARRVKLKIAQDRLAKMHPSDIAAILQELAPSEREAVFTSLPEETAAETLEEFEPKLQRELVEHMNTEHAADIIEEMDPAAAADLLGELSHEASEAILEEMEPEERQDVEDLLVHDENTAAGRMTTAFVEVGDDARVEDAVAALRAFEGDADTITEVYLVDADGRWKGVAPLARLLIALPGTPVNTMTEDHRVSCRLDDKDGHVAELFDKYNLRSLPVLNARGDIAGVIHAEQVIAQLMES